MDAIVQMVGETMPLKAGKYKGKPGKLIIFKDMFSKKNVKLYLPLESENASRWIADCKPGNIIEGLGLNPAGTIAWWIPYRNVIIKEKK